MAHVLLPTDLSDNALNAATYAVRLFGDEGHTFTLLHVLSPSMSMEGVDVATDLQLARIAAEGLTAFSTKLSKALAGMKPSLATVIEHGVLSTVVKRFRDDANAPALVVMGTQGATGIEEVLIGSNTADVIKHSGLPVLAVPHECTYTSPRRILLAEDTGPIEKNTLKPLLDIARWSQGEVTIVRVLNEGASEDTDANDSPYDVLLGAIPHTHQYLHGDDVQGTINALADQGDTDLIAIVHRQRGIFDGLFHRSTSARMVMHTHVPLLVLHQRSHS